MFMVFGNLVGFAFKAAWGITKVVLTFVFLPLILIGMFIAGAVYLVFPALVIAGIVCLIKSLMCVHN